MSPTSRRRPCRWPRWSSGRCSAPPTRLAASLLFCATRRGAKVGKIHADVKVQIARSENKRLRIAGIKVRLSPEMDPSTTEMAKECLGLFEDFCTVTASIRNGIPVEVKVDGFEK